MNKFLRQLITEWRRLGLPTEEATFVVAVSGGADSVSLLLAVDELRRRKKLRLEFVVAHFNHALRSKESDKDEAFVRKLADGLGLKFESGRWSAKKKKGNLEEAAREARYEFLEMAADRYNAYGILTGHTLDDQAETFLLRLIRGSGLDGLRGMVPVRVLSGGSERRLVRPLLSWAHRADTESFCRASKIKFRNDPMNDDERFSRVKVRKQLLPLLRELNPQITPNLAGLARIIEEDASALDLMAVRHLFAAGGLNSGSIDVKYMRELHPGLRKRVLRQWLAGLRGGLRRLEMKHFTAVERLVLNGTGGKTAELPAGERVSVVKGRLIFKRTKVEKSPPEN